MNEQGKLKHRMHLLVFRRGNTPGEDVLVEHVVTHRSRYWAAWRKMCRRFDAQHIGWIADEAYWREHGMAGRPK